jgi:hypothetical protein
VIRLPGIPDGLGLVTLVLAIDAGRYEDEQLNALDTAS